VRAVIDTNVLLAALLADLIITGDDDLLSLGIFNGIAIVAPAEALFRIGKL